MKSNETCCTPKQTKSVVHPTIGSLLGVTERQVLFIVNLEKLLHYYDGVSFTNNLSSHRLPRGVGVSFTNSYYKQQTTAPTLAQIVVLYLVYCE